MSQDGEVQSTGYRINDNASSVLLTPEVADAFTAVKMMPEGAAKKKALADLRARYPFRLPPRASLERDPDKSAALRLRDPDGHTRILLRVAADGTPSMQFLDATGKVIHQWPEAGAPGK